MKNIYNIKNITNYTNKITKTNILNCLMTLYYFCKFLFLHYTIFKTVRKIYHFSSCLQKKCHFNNNYALIKNNNDTKYLTIFF